MFKRQRRLLLLFAFCLASFLIFRQAVYYPFFQDDFFVLSKTQISSSGDLIRLLLPQPGVVYYRPVGIQLYFATMQLMGLKQPGYFHAVSFLTHWLNIFLVYLVTRKLFKPRPPSGARWRGELVAYLSTFFYAISPIHYLALGWAVNFSFILLLTWTLAAVWSWLANRKVWAWLFLALGLLTNEMAIVLPGLLWLVSWQQRGLAWFKKRPNQSLTAVSFGLAGVYLGWRLLLGLKTSGVYGLSISYSVQALRWYLLWMIGWADTVKGQMIGPITFRWDFIYYFTSLWAIYLVELAVLLPFITVWLMRTVKIKANYLRLAFSASWVLVSLLPVLFFRDHLYSHYSQLASLGVSWGMAQMLADRVWRHRLFLSLVAAAFWLTISVITTRINLLTSWLGDHARHSQMFQEKLLQQHETVPSDHRVFVVTTNKKVPLVLADGGAFKIIYGVDPDRVSYVETMVTVPGLGGIVQEQQEDGQMVLLMDRFSKQALKEEKVTLFQL